jgi:hypothetical protein
MIKLMRTPTSDEYGLMVPTIFEGLRSLKKITEPRKGRSKLKEFVGRGIRYYTEMKAPKLYSTEALNFCLDRGIDLRTLPLRNYSKIVGGDKNRPNLVLEHTYPIGAFIEDILRIPEDRWSYKMVMSHSICFITREEDDKLNEKGYKSKRPGSWMRCYKECGIDYHFFTELDSVYL